MSHELDGSRTTLLRSFGHAFRGLSLLFKSEPNARIHALLALAACGLGGWLNISRPEWLAILLCIGLVLAAEGFNSALERLADRVTTLKDPIIRDAKDLGAGAVLIASIIAAIVGAVVFLPKIASLLSDGAAGP